MGNSPQETYRYMDTNQLQMHELQLRVAALEKGTTLPKETIHDIKNIASYADSFDHILISGGSREVTRTILTAGGVATEKIVGFSAFENGVVYKRSPFYQGVHGAERVAFTKDALQQNGVPLENPTSLCIVDDYIATGDKARAYLKTFSQIPNLDYVSFAVFSVSPYLRNKFHQSENIVVPEHDDLYWNAYITRLTTIASALHPDNRKGDMPTEFKHRAPTALSAALHDLQNQILYV